MPSTITVSVTLGDRKVTLEGPEDFVQTEVRRLTDLIAAGSEVANAAKTPMPAQDHERRRTEREFVEEKSPKGHSEHVAVLAFFLADTGIAEFTEEEMRRAYIRAGVKPPKVVGQAIRDAKNKLDYIEPGSKPGNYKLSHHGENLVRFDLPRKG